MHPLKKSYWLVSLFALLICLVSAIHIFRAYDRPLSRDLERLGLFVGKKPGIALDDSLK